MFLFFCENDSILRPFLFKFWFERTVLSSAKRAQNKHKNRWRAQAKLLDLLSNDIMRRPKMKLNFLAFCDRLFAICRAANAKTFFRQCCFCNYKKINEKKITAEDR